MSDRPVKWKNNDAMYRILKIHGPWIGLMIAITIESSFSDVEVPDLGLEFADKIYHFTVFGVLGVLLIRGMLFATYRALKNHPFAATLIIGALFALSDEIHQSFVPGRSMDAYDWIADVLGIALFSLGYLWYLRKRRAVTEPEAGAKSP